LEVFDFLERLDTTIFDRFGDRFGDLFGDRFGDFDLLMFFK
jgi:hypothetical protein